jgi:hypothetical protein
MWNLMARQWLSVRIQATPGRSISCPYHNIYHDLNFYQQNNCPNKHKSVAILVQSGIITTSGQQQSSQKPLTRRSKMNTTKETFTKEKMRIVRKQLQAKLDELDIGITLTLGNCSFDAQGTATFKLDLLAEGAQTKEEQQLEVMAGLLNLDMTKIYNERKNKFVLSSYNSRSRTKPWIIKDLNTQSEYSTTETQAIKMFSK